MRVDAPDVIEVVPILEVAGGGVMWLTGVGSGGRTLSIGLADVAANVSFQLTDA